MLNLMRMSGRAWLGLGPDTKRTNPVRRCAAFLAFVTTIVLIPLVGVPTSEAQGVRTVESDGKPVRHVSVTLNKSRTLRIDRPFATAVVGAPEIADVLPMSDRSLYIQGKKIGTTNISVFDASMQVIGILDVEVAPDTGSLREKIGGGGIRVSSSNGQVVLSGEARDAVAADRAVSVAKGLSPETPIVNAMSVAPSQQVMLKVRFLEVSRAAGRQLGVNWFVANGKRGFNTGLGAPSQAGTQLQGTTNQTPGGVPLFQSIAALAGTGAGAPFGVALANLVNKNGTSVDVMINALETKDLVRSLAEPDLIALSGDTASFLAGGQYPYPTAQPGSTTGQLIITTQFIPFGVELTFTPTVLANGVINLRMVPSVSELDFTNAVQANGLTMPSLKKREARTTIELRDGQSFAIAGLLQANNQGDISQLPWLGSVPVLGALFRSTSYQQNETDLVIIVTPHLVKPAAPGQQLASPLDSRLPGNDVDVFLNGQLERKKKFVDYVNSGGDVQGPYGHMIEVQQGTTGPVLK